MTNTVGFGKLTLSRRRPLSYRNQSIDLLCKSFLLMFFQQPNTGRDTRNGCFFDSYFLYELWLNSALE